MRLVVPAPSPSRTGSAACPDGLAAAYHPVDERVPGVDGDERSPDFLLAAHLIVGAPGEIAPGHRGRDDFEDDDYQQHRLERFARHVSVLPCSVAHGQDSARVRVRNVILVRAILTDVESAGCRPSELAE